MKEGTVESKKKTKRRERERDRCEVVRGNRKRGKIKGEQQRITGWMEGKTRGGRR